MIAEGESGVIITLLKKYFQNFILQTHPNKSKHGSIPKILHFKICPKSIFISACDRSNITFPKRLPI